MTAPRRFQPPVKAFLTISPALYRRHLAHPDVLPMVLRRAALNVTGRVTVWDILEGQDPLLVQDTDFILQHPAQEPLGGPVFWTLRGSALAALLALRIIADQLEWLREGRHER